MNLGVALAICLTIAACLTIGTHAWGWQRQGGGSFNKSNYSRGNYSKGQYNVTGVEVAVRRVDEEHPYFRSFSIQRNASLSSLQQGLQRFFSQTSSVTWIVKNDRLLITRDMEVRLLNSRDQLEVWFTDSQAPTRSRTLYAFSKGARKASWSSSKGDKDKTKDKSKEKSKDKKKARSKIRGSEDEVEAESLELFDSY